MTRLRSMASIRRPQARGARRAFSLAEVLLAIFILAIGVIAVGAVFPAAIFQQRLSTDDTVGPFVADQAFALLSSRLDSGDFGSVEAFGLPFDSVRLESRLAGDWNWIRPSVLLTDDPATPIDEAGAIDVFSYHRTLLWGGGSTPVTSADEFPNGYLDDNNPMFGVPFNPFRYDFVANNLLPEPRVLVTRRERLYPMTLSADLSGAQYAWDCAFRRFQGRILVAVFVYRINRTGASTLPYSSPAAFSQPGVPYTVSLVADDQSGASPPTYSAGGAWSTRGVDGIANNADDALVQGLGNGVPFSVNDPAQAWQEPRQWLLDQNNNIHRVLGRTQSLVGPFLVRLASAPPQMPDIPPFFMPVPAGTPAADVGSIAVVQRIWYVPREVDLNGDGAADYTLTPVYAAVRELP
ncbi:MAG: prepilin-type N-terminal cleavage/methylation domain-containing protein [Phycisphaerales bacterium]|nr:prepilin-type N-terminal cleavage/methylation domain-containing protein [Phycisphaerales bacterium]